MSTVRVKLTKDEAKAVIARLPAVLAGTSPDPNGEARALLLAVGIEAMSVVREQFVVKSRGGTDSAGIRWQPLKERTVASRRHPGKGNGPRPSLTPSENALWKQIYVRTLRAMEGKGYGHADASGIAAGHAWKVVKAGGGQTSVEKWGNAPHEILRDTGRLLASFSPGSPDSLMRAEPGAAVVGSNVTYAAAHHSGTRSIPARPFWPQDWPAAWTDRLEDVLSDGMPRLAEALLRGFAP